MIERPLSGKIIGAAFDVHNELGFGFAENVYKNALYIELKSLGLKCECEKDIDVFYKGKVVGKYRADMIVEDKIIVELKSVSAIIPTHEVQLVNYLKATGIERGLIINFSKSVEVKHRIFSKNNNS